MLTVTAYGNELWTLNEKLQTGLRKMVTVIFGITKKNKKKLNG